MRDLAWDDVKDMFDPLANGTLPDVRIEGTNLDDWQAVIDLARINGWRHEYEENNTAKPLPARAVDIIDGATESHPEVRIWPGPGFLIIFRPYTEDSIEFEVNLREVQGQEGIDKLCALLRAFGRLLGKPVLMYSEGATDAADIGYMADGDRVVNLVPPERRLPPKATDR